MKKTLFFVLLLGLLLCCARADTVRMVTASDLHLLSWELVEDEDVLMRVLRSADGKVTHYTPEICRAFVDKMLEERPDAILLTGDLTLNGGKESHAELIGILKPLREAGIPVLAIPGNHDETGLAYRFQQTGSTPITGTNESEFRKLYADFGYSGARSRDEHTFSYMYEVTPTLWVLAVDVNSARPWGRVPPETLAWIEKQLQEAQATGAQVIGMSHQNLMVHFSMFVYGFQMDNAAELQALYEQYGVHLHLSGHMHLQHIVQQDGITEIATSALAVWPQHYGAITVADGVATYQATPLDVDAWAAKNGSDDPNLLDFNRYAAQFFDDTTLGKQGARMAGIEADEAVKAQLLNFICVYNRSQFAGYPVELLDTDELQLLKDYLPASYLSNYTRMSSEDGTADMRQAELMLK